jgi:hypothetical protein
MNEEETSYHFPFWPAFFLTLAFTSFLLFQADTLFKRTQDLKRQEQALRRQSENAQTQLAAARNMSALLEKLANDLLVLGTIDSDARKLVEKYQIRKTDPTTTAR